MTDERCRYEGMPGTCEITQVENPCEVIDRHCSRFPQGWRMDAVASARFLKTLSSAPARDNLGPARIFEDCETRRKV